MEEAYTTCLKRFKHIEKGIVQKQLICVGHVQKVFLKMSVCSAPTPANNNLNPSLLSPIVGLYIYIYRSEGLPLRDMLSPGAWRMGLGRSGEILPSSSSPSSSSPASFRQILEKSHHFQSFLMKNDILGHFVFRRVVFWLIF